MSSSRSDDVTDALVALKPFLEATFLTQFFSNLLAVHKATHFEHFEHFEHDDDDDILEKVSDNGDDIFEKVSDDAKDILVTLKHCFKVSNVSPVTH